METKPTKGTAVAVRYLVVVRFAFDASEDGYTHSYVVAAFPSRADALAAAEQALETQTCVYARVSRERWTEQTDALTGARRACWNEEAEIRELHRLLRPEEIRT